MSTENLINITEYNTKMNSNQSTIVPEDLSYAINIIDTQPNYLQLYDNKINLLEKKILDIKKILLFKLIIIIIMILVGLLCILYK
jgi:hypothetical protein